MKNEFGTVIWNRKEGLWLYHIFKLLTCIGLLFGFILKHQCLILQCFCWVLTQTTLVASLNVVYYIRSSIETRILCKYSASKNFDAIRHWAKRNAGFRLTCRLPHCRFDDDICSTAQAPLAAEGTRTRTWSVLHHVLSRITLPRARRVVQNWRFSNSHSV